MTSLALVSGDLNLYIGERCVSVSGLICSSAVSIRPMAESCLRELIPIFQGMKDITEAAYCQVMVEGRVKG